MINILFFCSTNINKTIKTAGQINIDGIVTRRYVQSITVQRSVNVLGMRKEKTLSCLYFKRSLTSLF